MRLFFCVNIVTFKLIWLFVVLLGTFIYITVNDALMNFFFHSFYFLLGLGSVVDFAFSFLFFGAKLK